MNETYLNCPDGGNAMSAQEFAASLGTSQGCGCGQTVPAQPCGCGGAQTGPCQQPAQTVCCFQVTPPPAPVPEVTEDCCCKQSFRAALETLCDPQVSGTLDFAQTAFLTDSFVAGTTLAAPPAAGAAVPPDNLAAALTGVFRRFSPCSCDLLDVSATPYYPAAGGTDALPFTATQVSLCDLSAVVIQQEAVNAEGDLTAEEVAARNFRRMKRALSARLNPCGGCAGTGCSCCADSGECCCAAGVLNALSGSNLSRRVTLTAGYLSLVNVELLGTVGNVLVLASDDTQRLYFVCASKVGFLG